MDRDDAILNYLQGRLAPAERDRFEAEMKADAPLAAEVDVMRAVRADLAAAPKHDNAGAVWNKLLASIDPPLRAANQNRSPWAQVGRYAAVALLAVVSWQFAVAPRIFGAPDTYRAASEETDAFILQVRFADEATMTEIGALLGPLDGTISDGPSALGIMRISFIDEAARQQAAEAFRARPALVIFVQEQ